MEALVLSFSGIVFHSLGAATANALSLYVLRMFLLLRNTIFAEFITIITRNDLFALFHSFSEAWLTMLLNCPFSSP